MARIPVGVLTGFLGSGKTTLLSRLLADPAFTNTVVVINEFGEVSIDHLVVANLAETIVELRNGCLCCTVRGDLVMTLRDLFRQRQLGELRRFDRVLVETSGLADPVPLLHTVLTNAPLQQAYDIDAVVTVVDALNAPATVAAHQTAADQVAVADVIVISKQDLATPAERAATMHCVAALNSQAPCFDSADVAPQQLFGRGLFNPTGRACQVADWLAHHEGASAVHHDHVYRQCVIRHPGPVSLAGLTVFLNQLVNREREHLLRIKGIAGARERGGQPVLVHAVQNKFYPLQWLAEWPDDDQSCRLVFIGRDLDATRLRERFEALCV
ncbi:MAG: GTP-binding protein [Gammaproteobacteria bacterium]